MSFAPPINHYPALYEMETKELHPLKADASFVAGRSQEADLPLLDMACSRQQFRIVQQDGRCQLEPLSQRSPTLVNGQPAATVVSLHHGAMIQVGASHFCFLEREDSEPCRRAGLAALVEAQTMPHAAVAPRDDRTMMDVGGGSQERLSLDRDIMLSGQMLIGRDAERAQICLPHPLVSRVHAQIVLRGTTASIVDLNSANGTFVNGRRASGDVVLRRGDRIDVGPYSLVFDGRALKPHTRHNNVELVGRELTRRVTDRNSGHSLTLLDHISLVVRPREFVCILGPSGSGKSTLLSALSARWPADEGEVFVNGENLYANFQALKQGIAVVPQKDALHDLLTVEQALAYSARLRLPPDTGQSEVRRLVDEMLAVVGLEGRRRTRICNLSGGQLKRASLANEIISQPSLMFLDEVTSGLDEQTDREMMELFRRIADTGKTVVCVTHNLAHVEDYCQLVVVLTPGGKLAFVGTPRESMQYFRVDRLGHIYQALATKSAENWSEAFLQHHLYDQYVRSRLTITSDPTIDVLRSNPRDWAQMFVNIGQQLQILISRYVTIQTAGWPALLVMAGQCLLVALLLALLFGNVATLDSYTKAKYCSMLSFLMTVSCLWFGCNNAAKEIVKERVIYHRERAVNLSVVSYYMSKLLPLGGLSLVQATVLLVLVKLFTQMPGGLISQWITLCALSTVGTVTGLAISAFAKTEDIAITIVPLVLIPQIVLAGVVAPVSGFAKLLAQMFISSYWGYRGLAAGLPTDIQNLIGGGEWSLWGSWFVLLCHFTSLVLLSLGILILRDRGEFDYRQAWEAWLQWTKNRLEKGIEKSGPRI